MLIVENKQGYTTLTELVNPRHTALVVVDMQNDFCKPTWAFDQLGINLSMYTQMIPRLVRLIAEAREHKLLIVYSF